MTGTFGSSIGTYGNWTGVVVSRDDPLKGGAIQVRIFGVHDDKVNIPDNQLPWAGPKASINSASINHIGTSPTGVMVGSTVSGEWADAQQTIPVFTGTIPRAQIEKNTQQSNQPNPYSSYGQQANSSPSLQNDVAHNARGVQKTGAPNETNMGKDFNTILQNCHVSEALNAISILNAALPFKIAKFPTVPSIGGMPFAPGQKILNLIAQVDPNNLSGSIQGALKGITGLKNITDAVSMASGNGNLPSMFASLVNSTNLTLSINNIVKSITTNASTLPVSVSTQLTPAALLKIQPVLSIISNMLQQAFSNIPGAAANGQASFNHMQGSLKVMENHFNTLTQSAQQPTTTTTTPTNSVSTTPAVDNGAPVNTTGADV